MFRSKLITHEEADKVLAKSIARLPRAASKSGGTVRTWVWLLLLAFTAAMFYFAGVVDERARQHDSVSVESPA